MVRDQTGRIERKKEHRLEQDFEQKQCQMRQDALRLLAQNLIMNRLSISRHGGLLECFGQGRMSVAGAADVFRAGAVFDGQGALGDHLARVGADDVDAQDPVRLGVRDEFHHALRVQVRLGARVGREGEGADFVLLPGRLDLLLVLPDPGHFRIRVHDGWNGVVVHVPVALLDVLDRRDGFFFRLVCKHRPEGAVANDADVGMLGSVFLIDDQSTLLIYVDADVLKPQAGRVWSSTDGNKNNIRFQLVELIVSIARYTVVHGKNNID